MSHSLSITIKGPSHKGTFWLHPFFFCVFFSHTWSPHSNVRGLMSYDIGHLFEGPFDNFLSVTACAFGRPHVTREKAVSCQITFKLYCFFSQFVANSSKASLSCYIYWDLRQLMVANSLRYLLRFCNSLWYLLRFMAILQQFQVFLMILLFTAFSLVTWGLS